MARRRGSLMLGILMALAVLLAAGCGGKEGSTSQPEKKPAADVGAQLKGKTVSFIVPYAPGGGYDTYTRMVAPFLEKYTGTTIVVKNVPGGGSLVGTNQLYTSPPDGLTIGVLNGVGVITSQVLQQEGVNYDLKKFTWLGRFVSEPQTFVVKADSRFKTFEDMINSKQQFKISATGVGASEYVNALALKMAFNLPAEIVTGYDGSKEADLAVIRGEVDATSGSFSSKWAMIKAGDARALVQIGARRAKELPDVPLATELNVPTQEGKQTLEFLVSMLEVGRALAGPPGMSPEVTKFWRDAIGKALSDPELLKQAQEQERPIENVSGEEMERLVQKGLNAPEVFIKALKDAYGK